jgi:hypothetical protein
MMLQWAVAPPVNIAETEQVQAWKTKEQIVLLTPVDNAMC